MDILQKSLRVAVIVICLVSVSSFVITKAYAQDNYDYTFTPDSSGDFSGGCDFCGGSYDYTYTPDSGSNYDYTYTPDSGSNYDYTYTPDSGSGYDYTYTPDVGSNYDYTYTPDSMTPSYSEVNYSEEAGYSEGAGYSTGYGYSTPTFAVTNPVYSTPGISYSSHSYATPARGYSAPVITPTPTTHTTTPAPIVYNNQTQTQPIVINNNNNNTNTNTNTIVNSAPVTPATPQTVVVYSQPIVPTYVPPVHTYVPPAPVSPYVSLNQIPYTGFDFGPVGDTLYWIALAGFALAMAYLLVYYRGGAFALASELIKSRRSSTVATHDHVVAHVEASKVENKTEVHTEAPAAAEGSGEAKPVMNNHIAAVIPSIRTLPGTEMRRATADAMIVTHSKNGEIPRIVITRA